MGNQEAWTSDLLFGFGAGRADAIATTSVRMRVFMVIGTLTVFGMAKSVVLDNVPRGR